METNSILKLDEITHEYECLEDESCDIAMVISEIYREYLKLNENYNKTSILAQHELLELLNYMLESKQSLDHYFPNIDFNYIMDYMNKLQLPYLEIKNNLDFKLSMCIVEIITSSVLNIQFNDCFKLTSIDWTEWEKVFDEMGRIEFINLLTNAEYCECAIAYNPNQGTIYVYHHEQNKQYSEQEFNEISCLEMEENSAGLPIIKSDSSSSTFEELENYGGFVDFLNTLKLDFNVIDKEIKDQNIIIHKGKKESVKTDKDIDIFDLIIEINNNEGIENVIEHIVQREWRNLHIHSLHGNIYIELHNEQKLKRLSLTNCNISGFENLKNMESLYLDSCSIYNIELENMNLKTILLKECTLSLNAINALKTLEYEESSLEHIIIYYLHVYNHISVKEGKHQNKCCCAGNIDEFPEIAWGLHPPYVCEWLEE